MLVLAAWLLTIPISASLSQTQQFRIQIPDYVAFSIYEETVNLNLRIEPNPGFQVIWQLLDANGNRLNILNESFFHASIAGNTATFKRTSQEADKKTVTIAAIRDGSLFVSKRVQVSVFTIQFSKDYVSFVGDFVHSRRIDIKLSTDPNSQPNEKIEWYFLNEKEEQLNKLDREFFSAAITEGVATFRRKPQKYGETEVTIVATKIDNGVSRTLAKKQISASVFDIPIPDYVSFYHDEKELKPINLELNPKPKSGEIRWYLLDRKKDRVDKLDEEFFSAKITGNQVQYEGVRGQYGDIQIKIVATKTIPGTPLQPEQKRNIAEKEVQVSVPRDNVSLFFISRFFYKHVPPINLIMNLKSRNALASLIVRGGDIMVILILLGLFGLALSIERIIFLFQLSIKKQSEFADEAIASATEFLEERVKTNKPIHITTDDNNPIAPIFRPGIDAINRNPAIDEEKLKRIIEEEMEKQEEELGRRTRVIDVCNTLAPIIGFFGTIVGLIYAFMDWTNSAMAGENIKVEDLAGGMYQAMVTTAGGLAVAIVLTVLLAIIHYRIRKLTGVMSDSKDRMLKILLGGTGESVSQSSGSPGSSGTPSGGTPNQQDSSISLHSSSESASQTFSESKKARTRNEYKIKKSGSVFSLTDIVLNLFIFFFITFHLIAAFKSDSKESNIKDMSVPRVTNSPSVPVIIKPIRVTIEKDGNTNTVRLDGVNVETLAEKMNMEILEFLTSQIKLELAKKNGVEKFEERPDQEVPSVIIAADEEVIYDYVVQVLHAVKNSDLVKIGLTAIPKEI